MGTNFETSLENIRQKVTAIGSDLQEANRLILLAISDCDNQKFIKARDHLKNIGTKTDKIDNEVIKVLALYSPEARDLREVIAYLKITNELSRACSNTRSFIRGFTDVCNETEVANLNEYAVPMQASTLKAIELTISMINCADSEEIQELYNDVLIQENKADDLYDIVERNLSSAAENIESFEKFHKMLKALRKSGKIATRALSIANLLVYAKVGGNFHS